MPKKVLCLCMVAVLAIGLAIPTFAATPEGITPFAISDDLISTSGSDLHELNIYKTEQPTRFLNIAGETAAHGANVTTYRHTTSDTQAWYLYRGADAITTIRPVGHLDLSLVRVSGDNCKIGSIASYSLDVLELAHPDANSARIRLKQQASLANWYYLDNSGSKLGVDENYYNTAWIKGTTFGKPDWTFTPRFY